ncbi:hypothetical protein [Methylobacterium sp. CM6246]
MASSPILSDLVKSREVTGAQLSAAVDAVLANPKTGPFELASGWIIDLNAAVKTDRHAMAILKEPTARPGSKRAAVKSALLLTHPVKK